MLRAEVDQIRTEYLADRRSAGSIQLRRSCAARGTRVCDVERKSARHRVDDRQLPPSEERIRQATGVRAEALSMSVGQVIDDRRHIGDRLIVARWAIVAPRIGKVHARRITIVLLEVPGGLIERAAPGKRVQHIERAGSLLSLDLQ